MSSFYKDASSSEVTRRRFLQLLGVGSAGAVLAACGGGSASSASSGLPSFPLGAAKKAKGVVDVTLWHSMTNANLTALQHLTKEFNASQQKIVVKLLSQASYTDTFTAYRAGLGSGNLPDIVQIESILLQDMIDSKSVVPASSALKADSSFDASDVVPAAMSYFTVDGVQYGMPWNCSSQIMYFNQKLFEKAGLDPSKPPTTFAEYYEMSEQAKKRAKIAYGTAIKLTASNVEDWMAQTGSPLFNNGNGRSGRATKIEIGNSTGLKIFDFFSEMFSSKVGEATSNTTYDNLFAIGNQTTAMAIDTSAALGTVLDLLGGGSYHNVTLGVGPLPGVDGPGEGLPYGGAGLYIVKHSTPERQDAAWQFIKYLLGAEQMAYWAIASGYIPITKSATKTASMQKAWTNTPQYKVAYEQLATTKANSATSGGVTGAFSQVETDIQNGMSLVSQGTPAKTALSQVVSNCNSALSSYNSSV